MTKKPKVLRVAKPKPDIDGARAFALNEAVKYRDQAKNYPDWWGPVADAYGSLGLRLEQITWPDGSEHGFFMLPDEVDYILTVDAEHDAQSFDLACHVCASAIEARMDLPAGLELFASKVLRGKLPRPQPKGSPVKHWRRDTTLFHLVWALEQHFGLVANPRKHQTENEATRRRNRPPSASAVILDAFVLAGYERNPAPMPNGSVNVDGLVITDKTAAKIWGDKNVPKRLTEAKANLRKRLEQIVREAKAKGANIPEPV